MWLQGEGADFLIIHQRRQLQAVRAQPVSLVKGTERISQANGAIPDARPIGERCVVCAAIIKPVEVRVAHDQ